MPHSMLGPLVGAIDEGTSSARFILFKAGTSEVVCSHQKELNCSSPHEGWLEQDPFEILECVNECIEKTLEKLEDAGGSAKDILTVGITNQRETTLLWDKKTGKPLYNAILWSDLRTSSTVEKLLQTIVDNDQNYFRPICGLPLITYFSAVKVKWLMDNVPEIEQAIKAETCLFGTVDSWVMWNMLNGTHITDVTNASRTMLMNIETLLWDETMLKFFSIPKSILPTIKSSSEIYGRIHSGPLKDIPISGCLGDQQAALVGQMCLREGEAKATYGTGCFILYNTGSKSFFSSHGLLTTVAYQFGKAKAVYALEGSAAVAGSAFEWLRNNLGIIISSSESQLLAKNVSDDGNVVFVPAFSGLFAPYWQHKARGTICGMNQDTEAGHIVKAVMEAICYQVKDIIESMEKDCGIKLHNLKVDGGVTANSLLMQMQADLGDFDVIKAGLAQSTALGVALAAQWAFEEHHFDIENFIFKEGETFHSKMSEEKRNAKYAEWKLAVTKSTDWATE